MIFPTQSPYQKVRKSKEKKFFSNMDNPRNWIPCFWKGCDIMLREIWRKKDVLCERARCHPLKILASNKKTENKNKNKKQKPRLPQLTVHPECAITGGRRDALSPTAACVFRRFSTEESNLMSALKSISLKANQMFLSSRAWQIHPCFGTGPWLQISRRLNSSLSLFIIFFLISYFYISKLYFNSTRCSLPTPT